MIEAQRPTKVLILGATSGIAEALARIYATEKAAILLAGRRADRLAAITDDLKARGALSVHSVEVDFVAEPDPAGKFQSMSDLLGGVDHVILAYGVLGDQQVAQQNPKAADDIIEVNFRSAVRWITAATSVIGENRNAALVVFGSVAGDRGRRANYVYGSAKAGLATFVEGLAHRFAGHGPRIVLVKPGQTDTAMTAGFEKSGFLWSSADTVAAVARRAADRGPVVVYAPAFWRYIMLVIRFLPTPIFNRLNI